MVPVKTVFLVTSSRCVVQRLRTRDLLLEYRVCLSVSEVDQMRYCHEGVYIVLDNSFGVGK